MHSEKNQEGSTFRFSISAHGTLCKTSSDTLEEALEALVKSLKGLGIKIKENAATCDQCGEQYEAERDADEGYRTAMEIVTEGR